METQPSSPVKEQLVSVLGNQPTTSSQLTPKPTKEATSLESSPSVTDVVTIPSCSSWFSWDKVKEPERRFLPEFFDEKSPSKNAKVYMYYRNSMIKMFRENPSRKITFTQVWKVLVGDVGSIRRVFDFLEGWGLINYMGLATKNQSKDDKENRSNSEFKGTSLLKKGTSTRTCSACKTVCHIACFVCDKVDLTFCSRCYVRHTREVGIPPGDDFRRVEISDRAEAEWTDKETLQLLEAIMHCGDDWKKVAEHVGGRSEKECVARFIKLPFKEQFVGPPDSEEVDRYNETSTPGAAETEVNKSFTSPIKKQRLTPFADTSNPIMAQVAFLTAVVGSDVAEAAARAAVEALSGFNRTTDPRYMKRSYMSLPDEDQNESASTASGNDTMNTFMEAATEAQQHVQKEEQDIEKTITAIVEVQMKELEDRIDHFEEVELQIEKERKQLQYMKNLLFTDQLTLLFKKTAPPTTRDSIHGAHASGTMTSPIGGHDKCPTIRGGHSNQISLATDEKIFSQVPHPLAT